jgi:hypothetical protein
MGKKTKRNNFELAPTGNHMARITSVAELGTQKTTWKGVEKQGNRWGVGFELVGPKTSAGKNFSVATTVSDSLCSMSKLFGIATAAMGKIGDDLDMEDLLGKTVQVSIVHDISDTGTWANIDQVSGLLSGVEVPETDTPLTYFDLDAPDPEAYEKLPALFKKKIEGRVQEEPPDFDDDDDVDY